MDDNKLIRLLGKFEEAAVNLSWKGSMDPSEYENIEQNYKKARRKLLEYINELQSLTVKNVSQKSN